MDLNLYKVRSLGKNYIENTPKDRGITLQAFSRVSIK